MEKNIHDGKSLKSRTVGAIVFGLVGFLGGAGTAIVGGVFGAMAGAGVFTAFGVLYGWSAGPDVLRLYRKFRG